MNPNNDTPSIRFAGFTDAWEQRKLGDFCKIDIGEFVIRTKQRDDAPYPVYNGGSSYTGFYDEFNQDGKKVIVSARGANAGFVNKCETPYWAGNSCYSIGVLDDTDWIFLYHAIKHVQLEFIKGQQSANIPSVSKEQVQKTEVACPSCQEQKKIAVFLEALDTLITLHQRKYDQLVNIKKSMLEKMFPKNGELVPEVRFAGFTDAWEQRKLIDETTEMLAGGDVDKNILKEEGKYPVVANALTNEGIVGYYDEEYRVKAPALTVTGRGDVGHAKARLVDFTPVVRLLSIKSEHDVHFLENAINTLRIVVESTGVPQLTVPQLSQYELKFPQKRQEEKQIGAFFQAINDLITLHQRKLERLQNIKKACLEKMFV